MSARAENTQMQLIMAAEELFATKGIDAVSLREINALAGQRNTSAVRYHFGDKAGMIEAILRERMTYLNRIRLEAFETLLKENPKPSIRSMVELVVRPLADMVLGTDEEEPKAYWRHYIKLIRQLASVGSEQYEIMRSETDYNIAMRQILGKMTEVCAEQPPELFEQRRGDLVLYVLNSLCERVVAEDKGMSIGLSRADFLDNMITVGSAMLTGPR